jgi:hypothetical protein
LFQGFDCSMVQMFYCSDVHLFIVSSFLFEVLSLEFSVSSFVFRGFTIVSKFGVLSFEFAGFSYIICFFGFKNHFFIV